MSHFRPLASLHNPKNKMNKSFQQAQPQSSTTPHDPLAPVIKPIVGGIGTGITPAIQFSQEEQIYHKHLTLGIEEKLQKNRMIKDITLTIRQPTEKPTVGGWERKHGVSLPKDLKDFYFSTNGFKLTWNLEHAGDFLKIGEININPINQLVPLEYIDRVDGGDSRKGGHCSSKLFDGNRPNFGKSPSSGVNLSNLHHSNRKLPPVTTSNEVTESTNFSASFSELRQTMEANGQSKSQETLGLFLAPNDKAFILDQTKYGWVCLIYPEARNKTIVQPPNSPHSQMEPSQASDPNVEIWFLDNSLNWHYLAPGFSHYYRMLLFHLGLPQWQYRFTPYGLSSWAEQMFWLVAPHLLTPPKISKINKTSDLWSLDMPPEAAVPNSTPNVLSSLMFRRKKKDIVEGSGRT